MSKNEISTANNVINIINTARENALRRVNEELILLRPSQPDLKLA